MKYHVVLALLVIASRSGVLCAADIAIDIGHDLVNPGCTSASGIVELEFNRRLAKAVVAEVESNGQTTHLLNEDGRTESLVARTAMAAKDRLFVSIHHDSTQAKFQPVTDSRFAGFSIWVSRKNRHYAASVECARKVGDGLLEAGFRPSHYHADRIYGENRPVIDWDRGIFARDELVVLKTARTPALLVEGGVIVNPAEETHLSKPETLSTQAKAIAVGLSKCLPDTRRLND